MDGSTLLPFLNGSTPRQWRDHVFMELDLGNPVSPSIWQRHGNVALHQANVSMLLDEHYKLVHFNGGFAPLLFDLQSDPDEMHNLAEDPASSALLLQMIRKLLDHRMTFADHSLSDFKTPISGSD